MNFELIVYVAVGNHDILFLSSSVFGAWTEDTVIRQLSSDQEETWVRRKDNQLRIKGERQRETGSVMLCGNSTPVLYCLPPNSCFIRETPFTKAMLTQFLVVRIPA